MDEMTGSFISSIHSATTQGMNRSCSEGSLLTLKNMPLSPLLEGLTGASGRVSPPRADSRGYVLSQIGDLIDAQRITADEAQEALDLAMRRDDTHELMSALFKARKTCQGKAEFLKMWLIGKRKSESVKASVPPHSVHQGPQGAQGPQGGYPIHQENHANPFYFQHPYGLPYYHPRYYGNYEDANNNESVLSSHTVVQQKKATDNFAIASPRFSPNPSPSPQLSTRSASPQVLPVRPIHKVSSGGELFFAPIRPQ